MAAFAGIISLTRGQQLGDISSGFAFCGIEKRKRIDRKNNMIQKIARISLREAFKHEAYDFTKWLQENLDVLNDCIDLTLSNAEAEATAGDFSVDLVAEDASGNKVIIENQLEKSNHDHLGKLITYLVAIEARAAIWIVSEPRPEHVSAITWLDESSGSSYIHFLKM